LAHYLAFEPGRTIKSWQATNIYGGSDGGKRYFDALRLVGLPEA
jgi:hypothetical protein